LTRSADLAAHSSIAPGTICSVLAAALLQTFPLAAAVVLGVGRERPDETKCFYSRRI